MNIDLENLKHHAEESLNVINLDIRNPKEYEMFPSAPTDHKFLLVFSVSNPRTLRELDRTHQRFIAQATPHTIIKLIQLIEAYEKIIGDESNFIHPMGYHVPDGAIKKALEQRKRILGEL